jgi:hypothetical protein
MNKKAKTYNTVIQPKGIKNFNFDKCSWDNLSEFQKQQIGAGLDDIKNGRVISSEEFWNQLKNG